MCKQADASEREGKQARETEQSPNVCGGKLLRTSHIHTYAAMCEGNVQMFSCLFCLSISCFDDVDDDSRFRFLLLLRESKSKSESRLLFIRHFNTFDSKRRRHCTHAHMHSLYLYAAHVLVYFSSIAVAASLHTHTHTHTRARTPAHSLTRTTTVDVMRDFRWSREMVVGGLFVATLFAASLSFVLKPRFVHLSGALNKGSLAF